MATQGGGATALLAADLAGSLSFYVASETLEILSAYLSLSEIVIVALVLTMALTSLESVVANRKALHAPGTTVFSALAVARDVVHTLLALTSIVTIQLSVILVRSSLRLPSSRLLSVLSTLLITQILLSAAIVQQRRPSEGKER